MSGSYLPVLTFGLAILCAGPALATEPVIVFDDTELAAIPEPFAVAAAQRLGLDPTATRAAVPASKFAFDSASIWPTSAPGSICLPDQPELVLDDVLTEAEAALDAVDYQAAIKLLENLDPRLACVAPPVDAVALARMYFLLGYARFLSGDPESASVAFAQAAVIDPTIGWDNALPPEPQQTFNNAVLEALRGEEVELQVAEGLPLDGLEIDSVDVAPGSLVRPGRHHLRVPTPGGGLAALAVDIAPGQPFELVPTAEIIQRWFGTPAEAREAVAIVAAPMVAAGATELYVLNPVSERIILVRPAEGQVLEVGATLARRGLRGAGGPGGGAGQPPPGVVMVIAGGVAAGAGLIAGLAERGNAMGILDDAVANSGQREQLRGDYRNAGDRMAVGFVIAGTGVAMLAVGIPLGVHQGRQARGTDASISGWWTAGGDRGRAGGIRLTGRW